MTEHDLSMAERDEARRKRRADAPLTTAEIKALGQIRLGRVGRRSLETLLNIGMGANEKLLAGLQARGLISWHEERRRWLVKPGSDSAHR